MGTTCLHHLARGAVAFERACKVCYNRCYLAATAHCILYAAYHTQNPGEVKGRRWRSYSAVNRRARHRAEDLRSKAARVLDLFNLDGRVAVVIGGSGGIGEDISLAGAGAGANVAVVGRGLDRCQRVADGIELLDREALAINSDATRFGQLQEYGSELRTVSG